MAVLSSLSDGMGDVFTLLQSDEGFRNDADALPLLTSLASQIGAANRPSEVAMVVRSLESLESISPDAPSQIVEALVSQQQGEARSALLAAAGGGATELIDELIVESKAKAVNRALRLDIRTDAIRSLGLAAVSYTHLTLPTKA